MEAYFASLTQRQTALLLTAVTFSGADALGSFEHLPEDESALLRYRAQELLQIPRDRRIPLLVSELKRVVQSRRAAGWGAEPEQLAKVLAHERGALVEVLLRALPAALATAVRVHLPQKRAQAKRDIKPEVLNLVRWKLEEILQRSLPPKATFRFADLRQIAGRELLTLIDRLGIRALGAALAGVDPTVREGMLATLSPELPPLVQRAIVQSESRKLLPEDSAELLALHQGQKRPLDALRSAGAQRLMRAAMAQSPEFAAAIVERFRMEAGIYLNRWHKEEKARTIQRGDGGRMEVVVELEHLAEKGLVERPVRLPAPEKPALPKPRLSAPPPVRTYPPQPPLFGEPSEVSRAQVSRVEVSRAEVSRSQAVKPPRFDEALQARKAQVLMHPVLREKPILPLPPHLRPPGSPGATSPLPAPGSLPGSAVAAPRRDMMAERRARQAGASSSRSDSSEMSLSHGPTLDSPRASGDRQRPRLSREDLQSASLEGRRPTSGSRDLTQPPTEPGGDGASFRRSPATSKPPVLTAKGLAAKHGTPEEQTSRQRSPSREVSPDPKTPSSLEDTERGGGGGPKGSR